MKVLLDDCVSRSLKRDFVGHDIDHVTEFLDNFPSVKKVQVATLLEIASVRSLEGIGLYSITLKNYRDREDFFTNR